MKDLFIGDKDLRLVCSIPRFSLSILLRAFDEVTNLLLLCLLLCLLIESRLSFFYLEAAALSMLSS